MCVYIYIYIYILYIYIYIYIEREREREFLPRSCLGEGAAGPVRSARQASAGLSGVHKEGLVKGGLAIIIQ